MSLARNMEKLAALSISKMPTGMARLFGKTTVDGQTLDPHLKLVLGANKSSGGFETLATVEDARKAYQHLVDMLERPEAPIASTQDRQIETPEGAVPIRIYAPSSPGPRPCVVYFHGGGYTIGDLETHDGLCRRLCRELAATVVAVDYRLAPEDPFPAGVDDSVAVTRWVLESTAELEIDAERVALAGDSAGGNFAAVVSQEVPGIKFQLLIYPGTDARSQLPSKTIFAEHFGLDKSTIDWFFAHYSQGTDRAEPRLSPAASNKLSQSPNTHVAVAGFDVLRDEGLAYAQLLKDAGVNCTVETHSSLCHGFVHMTRIPGCDKGVARLIEDLRRGLET